MPEVPTSESIVGVSRIFRKPPIQPGERRASVLERIAHSVVRSVQAGGPNLDRPVVSCSGQMRPIDSSHRECVDRSRVRRVQFVHGIEGVQVPGFHVVISPCSPKELPVDLPAVHSRFVHRHAQHFPSAIMGDQFAVLARAQGDRFGGVKACPIGTSGVGLNGGNDFAVLRHHHDLA